MSDMISMAIKLHSGFIVLLVLVLVLLYRHFSKSQDFKPFSLKYEKLVLFYRAVLGSIFLTGVVVMAVAKFQVSWMVYVMVVVILHLIMTSVLESKLYKSTHLKDVASQELFIQKSKKRYLIALIMVVVLTVVTYAVSLS